VGTLLLDGRVPETDAFFATRARSNMNFHWVYSAKKNRSLICDQTLALDGHYSEKNYPDHLRRVRFKE